MKKLYMFFALVMTTLMAVPYASATQSWNFTSNSNPKAVVLHANQINGPGGNSSSWDAWNGHSMTWDTSGKYWYVVFTANATGFNFGFKCTNTSNNTYYYKGDGTNINFSNGKASKSYAINENDGNGSKDYYCGGLTSGTKYIMKLTAHSGVTNCADMTIEPYSEPSTSTPVVTGYKIKGSWTSTSWTEIDLVKNGSVYTASDVKVTNSSCAFGVEECYDQAVNGSKTYLWYNCSSATNISATSTHSLVIETTSGSANPTLATGTWSFSYNPSTHALTCTKAAEQGGNEGGGNQGGNDPETTAYTVYFDATGSGLANSNVYCYMYKGDNKNAAWPGVQMTAGSNNTYSYTLNSTWVPDYVIFNNNNGTQYPSATGFAFENGATYTSTGKKIEGGNQGGGQTGGTTVYIMGGNSDWETGTSTTTVVNNQATITVANWLGNTFKFKVNDTWYGVSAGSTIVNGVWFENVTTNGTNDNISLPTTATGKDVTFTIATDNGHFMASWPLNVVSTPSAQENYPGGTPIPGIVKNNDGTVTFCYPAPLKTAVSIKGAWDNYAGTLMKYQDYEGYRYFWATINATFAEDTWYPYYYEVDEYYNVADPYATLILEPTEDAQIRAGVWDARPAYPAALSTLKVNPATSERARLGAFNISDGNYDWKVNNFTPADRSTLSIYEMLIRDFTGTNNAANGEGTFRSAMEKIPYLKDLGITAIELMPVMEFNWNNSWGYDTNSHFAVDKSYGSPDDMRAFVDCCHENGIAVIMDMVFNHVTDRHAWVQMYESKASPFFNAEAPHAWSVHNDFKQEYPLVEPYFKAALKHWIDEFKIDGFRFDLVKGMGDNASYANDNFMGDKSNSTTTARMKRIHAYMKTLNPNIFHINEFFGHYDDDVVLGNDGQMVWNHQMHDAQLYAACVKDGNNCADLEWCSWSKISRPAWGTVDYIESHDEPWLGYVAKNSANVNVGGSANFDAQCNRLAALGAQLLVAYGPKMIWEFGELGYDEKLRGNDDEDLKNIPCTEEHGNYRLERKKVHWEYLDVPQRKNIHDTYRAMLHLRNNNPELFAQSVTPVYTGFTDKNDDQRSIRITSGTKEVVVLINQISHEARTVTTETSKVKPGSYKVLASSYGFTPNVTSSGSNISVSIPANGFCVLASNDVASEPVVHEKASVAGAFNDWSATANESSEIVDNCVTVVVPNWSNTKTGKEDGFKIVVDGNIWYSNQSTSVPVDGTWQQDVTSDGDNQNMKLVAAAEGQTVKFTIAVDNGNFKAELVNGSTDPVDPEDPEDPYSYYLHGSFTSDTWTDVALTGEGTTLSASDVNVTYDGAKFGISQKLGEEKAGWWYASTEATVSDGEFSLELVKEDDTKSGHNISIPVGVYDFSYDTESHMLIVNKTGDIQTEDLDPQPVTLYTIYFDAAGSNFGSTVNCYVYDADEKYLVEWPGAEMTAMERNGIYSYSFSSDTFVPTNVIFSSGNTQYPASGNPGFDFVNGAKYTMTGATPMVYLFGSMNDWKGAYMQAPAGIIANNCAIFNIATWNGDWQFKIVYDGEWYGHTSTNDVYNLTTGDSVWTDLTKDSSKDLTITSADKNAVKITFAVDTKALNVVSTTTGIDGIYTDNADEVIYYNLQGVRVVNPAAGLYIMRQGNKVSKVLVK